MTSNEKVQAEYQAWLTLVELLRKSKAVTDTDCSSSVTLNRTPGQQLFNAIRAWGEALVEARIENGE